MAKHDFDLICIGSGPAGQRAAVQAAKLRHKVAIVERNMDVGGVCLHTGTIPSKTFREAVIAMSGRRRRRGSSSSQQEGRRQGDRVTASELLTRVSAIVDTEAQVQFDQLSRNGVDIIAGAAEFTGPHSIAVKSGQHVEEVTADNILISVGTRPHGPGDIWSDIPGVLSSDEVMQMEELPRSMIVVGCGVIGIEYASMFATLGVKVTVVDGRSTPLEFVDREIVDELIHQLRKYAVTFRLGEFVDRTEYREGPPGQAVVHLESGKRLAADVVLACTGRMGASDSLALDAAGLSADDRGRIKVNEEYRSEVPHIFAAGDIIGYPSLAATSSEQGRLAACYAFGVKAEPMPAHFPIGIYAIPEISMVGEAEHTLTEQKVPYETGISRYREIARGHILGDDTGMLKLIFHAETKNLIGVHAIGTGATELVHIGQAVIALGGGIDYFLTTVFNYPTLAECYKVAALDANNKLTL